MALVSVVIPTFNRFQFLIRTIVSVKRQTYPLIEIIVVNDGSTEKDYYTHDWKEAGVTMVHLKGNSRDKFGFPSIGYVRNKGISIAEGDYICFCDDDDTWFPEKVGLQLNAMMNTGCRMSSTDGLIGSGAYDHRITYKKYNAEANYTTLQNIYRSKGSDRMEYGFPQIWDLSFLKIHNCMICSSVMIEKRLLSHIGNFQNIKPPGEEDYDCWLRALAHTNSVYVSDVCFYYDMGHGYGQEY
jgi:glycosyltransferase involved in cell wall biosynthesis